MCLRSVRCARVRCGRRRTSVADGDAVGVDCVGVVGLGRGLAGGEAGEGSHAESEAGTHCG